MLRIVFIVFFTISFTTLTAQTKLVLTPKRKNSIDFLAFSSDSISPELIKRLNTDFGYQSMVKAAFTLAPAESPESLAFSEVEHQLLENLKDKSLGSLADVDFEILLNKNNFLCFNQVVFPEGLSRQSNSLVSDYPYIFPHIYNLASGKEIKLPEEFLTEKGIQQISKNIKEILIRRSARKQRANTNPSSCRIHLTSAEEFKTNSYIISNLHEHNDIFDDGNTGFYFSFLFTQAGMELGCNKLNIQTILCDGPDSGILIPWTDLKEYLIKTPENVINEIAEASAPAINEQQREIAAEFTSIYIYPEYEAPDHAVVHHKEKPYLVKGDKVQVLARIPEWVKINYVAAGGSMFSGWIPERDLLK